jgi:opacity protein-like surface antigen
MFKKTITTALTFSVLTASSFAVAEGNYFGGNFAFIEYSEEGLSGDASLTALYGRLGTNFSENFSGELRVGLGVGDDSLNVLGTDVDLSLEHMLGLYIRGGVPLGESVFPYAVIGYTRGKFELSASGLGSASASESDVSFGLGTDFKLNEGLSVNVEYMNYIDKDGGELSGFALGFTSNF